MIRQCTLPVPLVRRLTTGGRHANDVDTLGHRVGLAIAMAVPACAAVPFWGLQESSPAGTPSAALKPGSGSGVATTRAWARWWWSSASPSNARTCTATGAGRVDDGQHRQAGPRDAGQGRSRHPAEGQGPPLEHLQQCADAVPAAPDLGRRRAACRNGLPGYPESPAASTLPSAFAEKLFGATNMG